MSPHHKATEHPCSSTCAAPRATQRAHTGVPRLDHALVAHGCWGQHCATQTEHGRSRAAARNTLL